LFRIILIEQRIDVPLDLDLEWIVILLPYPGRSPQFLDDSLNIHHLHALLLHPNGQASLGQLDPDGSWLSLHRLKLSALADLHDDLRWVCLGKFEEIKTIKVVRKDQLLRKKLSVLLGMQQ
jgi:hypothetical protein